MRMFLEKYPIKEKYLSFTAHSNTHLKFTFCNTFTIVRQKFAKPKRLWQ